MPKHNISGYRATVIRVVATDGSDLYDVVQNTYDGKQLRFVCTSKARAIALANSLNETVGVFVETDETPAAQPEVQPTPKAAYTQVGIGMDGKVKGDTVAWCDAYLKNAGLPTYSDLAVAVAA